jgi:two-component system chemotaxis response regulator CheY
MKVLLVDDSATMRTIQKRCLNKLGIDTIAEAEDGQQALQLFEQGGFDVVLTDWNMPNMDGLSLLKEIRKRDRDVPVVMITTEAERARVLAAIEAGVTDYLVKPFTPDTLREKLERWVGSEV